MQDGADTLSPKRPFVLSNTAVLFLLAVTIYGLFALWPKQTAETTENEKGTIVFRHFGKTQGYFHKAEKIDDNVYMVFGFEHSPNYAFDGYLGVIPVSVAKPLLVKHPNLNQCGDASQKLARKIISNILLIYDPKSPDLTTKIKTLIKTAFQGPYRMCVRVTGRHLTDGQIKRHGKYYLPDPDDRYIYVSDIQQVSCD